MEGGFTTTAARGCAPLTVSVTTSATVSSAQYSFIYSGKGLPNGGSQTTYTYGEPGSFTILQAGSGASTGVIACKVITVLPTKALDFSVTSCGNRQATVKFNLDSLTRQYEFIDIDWGDNTPVQTIAVNGSVLTSTYTHIYATAATYIVNPQGRYTNLACKSTISTKAINVQNSAAPIPPVVSKLATTDPKTISITYQAPTGTTVLLAQKTGGTYQPTSLSGGATGVFTVPTDATQVQCFKLTAQDGCGLTQTSEEVCSLVLSAQAVSKQNNLSWQPYAGTGSFRQYTLVRDGTTMLSLTGSTNKATASFADVNKITCNVPYCYVLSATVGPTIITSAPACVTGINQEVPGLFRQAFTSVEGEKLVRFQVLEPTVGVTTNYTILVGRADSPQGPFQPVGQVQNNNIYRDTDVNPNQQSYCYQASYLNSCGLQSPLSTPVCTVWLSSQSSTGIDWTADAPYAPGTVAIYNLEISDTTGSASRQLDLGSNTHFEPDPNDISQQAQRYRIVAVGADGTLSYSNYYTFRRDPKLYVPMAFSPNGDGLNDKFIIQGTFLDNTDLWIYNRWGNAVYQSKSLSAGWDGTYNGTPLPTGPYMYRVRIVDQSGVETVKTGTIVLLR